MKRVLCISDTHCGSIVGLTPPAWQLKPSTDNKVRDRLALFQRIHWHFFVDGLRKYGPFDVVLFNADGIEGKGTRSGGSELITADRQEQAEMCSYAVKKALNKKSKLIVTYGTAYHTGDGEDFEDLIARDCNALKIGSHEWVDVEGVMFDLKHHCGSSSIPHGRHTAVARERMWNLLWADAGEQPKADVIIRSHVHYYDYNGDRNYLGMTTPALQGMGTKYGARRCSGTVDYGFVVFEVNKGSYSWYPVLLDMAKVKSVPLVIR